ncbi:MAG: hypothetical protein KDD03_10190, partial [Gelidibacter sp.]|nr:hypothetical protein [Gelidibacter sp.]
NIYLKDINKNTLASQLSYEEQVNLIKSVQFNVLHTSPSGDGIPMDHERRPKDLYESGQGLCFDRSFVMELIFQHLGFETRHVCLFKDCPEKSTFIELTSENTENHAISEIKTKKGWLIVDSNDEWVGIDDHNAPISMDKISNSISNIAWKTKPPGYFYTNKNHYIYGLYSRHGRFYKPYDFIPDYNINELLSNLN